MMRVQQFGRNSVNSFRSTGYLFLPGLFLVLIGVIAVFAPMLLLGVIAAFCVTVGVLFCLLTWKFLHFKKHVESLSKQFKDNQFRGTVEIRGMRVGAAPEEYFVQEEIFDETEIIDAEEVVGEEGVIHPQKKIVFH